MDIAKSETFKNFIILNKALLFLIKLSKTAVQSVPNNFKSFLKDRSKFVSIDSSHSSLPNINIGVAQGKDLRLVHCYSCYILMTYQTALIPLRSYLKMTLALWYLLTMHA